MIFQLLDIEKHLVAEFHQDHITAPGAIVHAGKLYVRHVHHILGDGLTARYIECVPIATPVQPEMMFGDGDGLLLSAEMDFHGGRVRVSITDFGRMQLEDLDDPSNATASGAPEIAQAHVEAWAIARFLIYGYRRVLYSIITTEDKPDGEEESNTSEAGAQAGGVQLEQHGQEDITPGGAADQPADRTDQGSLAFDAE